jgi:hypothetical protein
MDEKKEPEILPLYYKKLAKYARALQRKKNYRIFSRSTMSREKVSYIFSRSTMSGENLLYIYLRCAIVLASNSLHARLVICKSGPIFT